MTYINQKTFYKHNHSTMKKFFTSTLLALLPLLMMAQGWASKYEGVLLQGFYWNSFADTRWTNLTRQADELSQFFNMIWVPQSGQASNASGSMGYDPKYYFNQNSAFGSETQLREMINTYKAKGVGFIADVVVNHRANVSNWVDFPAETYKGVTYQMQSTDIVEDDDGGKALTWAKEHGYELSKEKDEGEGWDGFRDLDHKSQNVNKNIKAYCDFLVNDLGYQGFRYDVAKGFNADHIADYNQSCGVKFSVGEYWDGNATALQGFINRCTYNGTKMSGAFDFNFRYAVRDAVNNSNGWKNLAVPSLVSNSSFKRYAVTFVENHDTEARIDGNVQDPIKKDTLACNAFLLSMPGTPCVFLTHWKPYKDEIKGMIMARKLVGVTNESLASKFTNSTSYNFSVFRTSGTSGKYLYAVVGRQANKFKNSDFASVNGVEVMSGWGYKLLMSPNCETPFLSLWGGDYNEPVDVKVIAVSAQSGAQLVYTTDGSTPTASSTKIANGGNIHIAATTTLKVGLLVGGSVTSVVTAQYNMVTENKTKITVHVNADAVNWTSVNFWSWNGDGTHAPDAGGWPGDKVSTTVTVDGKQWFTKSYWMSSSADFVDLVFSTGSGSPQTVDVLGTNKDAFYEISAEMDGTKYKVNDVTSQHSSGIATVEAAGFSKPVDVYSIDGRLVRRNVAVGDATVGLPRGIYIVGHKKVVVR